MGDPLAQLAKCHGLEQHLGSLKAMFISQMCPSLAVDLGPIILSFHISEDQFA